MDESRGCLKVPSLSRRCVGLFGCYQTNAQERRCWVDAGVVAPAGRRERSLLGKSAVAVVLADALRLGELVRRAMLTDFEKPWWPRRGEWLLVN
jgi:hypothetical protein